MRSSHRDAFLCILDFGIQKKEASADLNLWHSVSPFTLVHSAYSKTAAEVDLPS